MNSKWSLAPGVILLLFASFGASAADAQTFGGSATGVEVTVPATGTTIRAATGTVPIAGGGATAGLLVGDIPGSATGGVVSLAAGTLSTAIVGISQTAGGASMSNVNLTVSGNQITAAFLMARSAASCSPAVAGSSEIQSLVINGQPITVTGSPNQTVNLSNGTVIINRQVSDVSGSSASLIVDALNVTTRDTITQQELANVVLGNVESQIDCSGGSQPNETWTTGGGWIYASPNVKGTFGVSGGKEEDGTFKGNVVYEDHGLNIKIKSTVIDDVVGGCTTTIHGYDRSGPDEIEFTVTVEDHGEPGSSDTFTIQAFGPMFPFGVYNATGVLQGGNIKAHNETCN